MVVASQIASITGIANVETLESPNAKDGVQRMGTVKDIILIW